MGIQKILLSVFAVLFATSVHANNFRPIRQTSSSVIRDFVNVSQCSERIWPGYSWAGQTILAVDTSKTIQLALDLDALKPFAVTFDQIPNSTPLMNSTFGFLENTDRKWILVNRNVTQYAPIPHSTFMLGVHEAFHHIGQVGWNKWSHARGTEIPISARPRVVRAMLYLHLYRYFVHGGDSTDLGKARYWFDIWKREFPNEVAATTDGYEGTAQYSEYIGGAFAVLGCKATEDELKTYIVRYVKNKYDYNLIQGGRMLDLDTEGYEFGSLASFILRWNGPGGWQNQMQTGQTPVEILLREFAPIAEEPNESLSKSYSVKAQQQEDDAERKLAHINDVLKDENTLVVFPFSQNDGSVLYSGFYNDFAKQINYGVVAQTLNFVSGQTNAQSENGAVTTMIGDENPCGQSPWVFAVRTKELSFFNGIFVSTDSMIHGSLHGSIVHGRDGQRWLCVQ